MGLISRVSSRTYRQNPTCKSLIHEYPNYSKKQPIVSIMSRSREESPALDRHGNPRDDPPKKTYAPQINNVPSKCIGVFGMSKDTDEKELRYRFGKYGEIDKVVLVWNHQTNESKGYAFITYRNTDASREAVTNMNGQDIDGKEVRVDFSLTDSGRKSRERRRYDKGYNTSRRRSRSYSRSRSRSRSRSSYRRSRRSRSRTRSYSRSRSRSYDRRRRDRSYTRSRSRSYDRYRSSRRSGRSSRYEERRSRRSGYS